jgi:formyltetrahydrofolate synthetase
MTDAFFSDDATLLLQTNDTSADIPIAGIQDIEIVPSVSIEQLYTGDSIKIDEQQQHEFEVSVDIGFSKWDLTLASEWLGGNLTTSTSMADNTDPQKYSVTSSFTEVNAGAEYEITVTGITFEEMPIIAVSRGEFIQWDLSGTGEDITDLSEVV